MDRKIFVTVGAPTLVNGAPLIGITTKGLSNNFVNLLIEKKKRDGTPLFNVIDISLVCSRCKRAREKEKDKKDTCLHMEGEIPYWHDKKRHRDLEVMLSDYADELNREVK